MEQVFNQALIARKNGKMICVSFLRNKLYNNDTNFEGEDDLYSLHIRKEYIGEDEKEDLKEWYKDSDWYGYDTETEALKSLNTAGEFQEKVFPPEIVGNYGNITISIENM